MNEYEVMIKVYVEANSEIAAIEHVRDELGLDIDTEMTATHTGTDNI